MPCTPFAAGTPATERARGPPSPPALAIRAWRRPATAIRRGSTPVPARPSARPASGPRAPGFLAIVRIERGRPGVQTFTPISQSRKNALQSQRRIPCADFGARARGVWVCGRDASHGCRRPRLRAQQSESCVQGSGAALTRASAASSSGDASVSSVYPILSVFVRRSHNTRGATRTRRLTGR